MLMRTRGGVSPAADAGGRCTATVPSMIVPTPSRRAISWFVGRDGPVNDWTDRCDVTLSA